MTHAPPHYLVKLPGQNVEGRESFQQRALAPMWKYATWRQEVMPPSEYMQFWGSDNLLHYDAAVVNSLSISAGSKQFLIECGLPACNAYYFPLYAADPTLPYVETVCFHPELIPLKYRHLRFLGTRCLSLERPVHYGICAEEGGVVYAIRDSTKGEIEIFFVSSSVQQYAQFMVHLERWRQWLYETHTANSSNDEMEAARKLVRTLRKIDPLACELETPSGLETEFGGLITHIEFCGRTG